MEKRTVCVFNNVRNIYLSSCWSYWTEVKWLLTSAQWVTVHHNSSGLLCLLTFWLVDGTPARQRNRPAERPSGEGGVVWFGEQVCSSLECMCVSVCVFSKKRSLTPIQTQWGSAVFTEVWSGLGPDWIITPSCITMKVRSSRGSGVSDLANKLKMHKNITCALKEVCWIESRCLKWYTIKPPGEKH